MAHNDYAERLAGLWPSTRVPTPRLARHLDELAAQAVNGDEGGTWAPSSPLVLGGAGVQLQDYAAINGGLQTGTGALAGGALILGDSDLPVLDPPRSRTVIFGVRDLIKRVDVDVEDAPGTATMPAYRTPRPSYDDTLPLSLRFTNGSRGYAIGMLPAFRLISGALIESAVLHFRVGRMPTMVPPTMPGFRLFRLQFSGAQPISGTDLYLHATWAAATLYPPQSVVLPAVSNGFKYRSLAGHTSGVAPPVWPTVVGATVADNGGTWTTETLNLLPTWARYTTYPNGHVVVPSTPNSRQYRVTAGGDTSSGATEPVWPTGAGATVADGGLTWTCETVGTSLVRVYLNTFTLPRPSGVAAYFAGGQPQEIRMLPNQNAVLAPGDYAYGFEITDPTRTDNTFHSIELTYSGIDALRPTF